MMGGTHAERGTGRSALPATQRALPRAAGLLAVLVAAGCASTQEIQLQCVPEQVQVYVDGRLLEDGTDRIELTRDAPHKIFAKAPGHQPQLVVLEPRLDAEGRTTLGPDALCIELVPVGMGRELEIEMEEDVEVEVEP